ncbi:ferredoxin [Algicella marina]|nr:ferredoxin [Algicella marina]
MILGTFASPGTMALIGPAGPAFWRRFTASPEYADGQPDPLDRWSTRVLTAIAIRNGAVALFPFGGPPWHPFLDWALSTGRVFSSPVNLLVHAEHGLFVSFRAAMRFFEVRNSIPPARSPCPECHQPCRTACPVGALTSEGYNVPACKAHIRSPEGVACRSGCLVRRACPVGANLRLPDQSAFHMDAFVGGGS